MDTDKHRWFKNKEKDKHKNLICSYVFLSFVKLIPPLLLSVFIRVYLWQKSLMDTKFIRNVLLKALALFVAVNLVFVAWNPTALLGHISAYNLLFPGRERFPFGENPARSYNLSLYSLPAMFELAGDQRSRRKNGETAQRIPGRAGGRFLSVGHAAQARADSGRAAQCCSPGHLRRPAVARLQPGLPHSFAHQGLDGPRPGQPLSPRPDRLADHPGVFPPR